MSDSDYNRPAKRRL
ncbi:hypothetical protein NUU61_007011 [Penicillium alfredii]|uniref:Uncharacterized protein n=1 Tax=Penicillium alfredii TaxID=1506179 RepID=A0A9W9F271_9EURO|nr:hypothetical protein NUU61_007011 [Penicillium alfredii]